MADWVKPRERRWRVIRFIIVGDGIGGGIVVSGFLVGLGVYSSLRLSGWVKSGGE